MNHIYDIIHWGVGTILFVVSLFLFGCVKPAPVAVIYKPIPCEIAMPIRPINASDSYLNTVNIVRYAEELELILKACKGL